MRNRYGAGDQKPISEQLVSPSDVAELMGVSTRKVLMLPIKQIRIGARTIRYRLAEVYEFLGMENPNL